MLLVEYKTLVELAGTKQTILNKFCVSGICEHDPEARLLLFGQNDD